MLLIWNFTFTVPPPPPPPTDHHGTGDAAALFPRKANSGPPPSYSASAVSMFQTPPRRRKRTHKMRISTTWLRLSTPTATTQSRKTGSRRVHFATSCHVTLVDSSPPLEDYDPKDLWYTNKEYAEFEEEIWALSHDFQHSAWLRDLIRVYRSFKDNHHDPQQQQQQQQQQVHEILESNSYDKELPTRYLGLELWLLPEALERSKRHDTLRHHIVDYDDWRLYASPRMRQTSATMARPASLLAFYIAQRVAQSLQEDPTNS